MLPDRVCCNYSPSLKLKGSMSRESMRSLRILSNSPQAGFTCNPGAVLIICLQKRIVNFTSDSWLHTQTPACTKNANQRDVKTGMCVCVCVLPLVPSL